jgi:membrane-bound lytic murein transglycosylase MltF
MVTLLMAVLSFLMFSHTETKAAQSLLKLDEQWTGDLDGMLERRRIRVLVPYSKTYYFLDGATQRGIAYEVMKIFEEWLDKELNTRHLLVHVVMIPTPRDELFSGLLKGRGDIATGNLTITPERSNIVDFSDPFVKGVREIVVAGKGTPVLKNLDDLAGQQITVRTSSSYYESLKQRNKKFKKAGKKPIKLLPADEYFEDEDLLEMANAGLISFLVVDFQWIAKATFFREVM